MNPTGPYPVGVADVGAVSPTPDVARLAARLFYPCKRAWTIPCTWIPHFNYAWGYVGYAFRFIPQKSWKTELSRAALITATWALGGSRILPVYYHAPVAAPQDTPNNPLLPVVVFSHGLAGTRNAYSSICIELASQGFVVMALEHSDGSASTARLPKMGATNTNNGGAAAAAVDTSAGASTSTDAAAEGSAALPAADACAGSGSGGPSAAVQGDDTGARAGSPASISRVSTSGSGGATAGTAEAPSTTSGGAGGGGGAFRGGSEWCFYGGFGDKTEQLRKTSHRVAEVHAAYRLLEQLHTGLVEVGRLRELPDAVVVGLRGRMDLARAAVVGHSYGGATAAAAAAHLSCFRAAVSLDPWWDCYDDQWPVLTRWVNPHRPPLLVIGSDDWNTPTAEGKLKCGGANQERVLAAAAESGGGAVLMVPRGSTHSNFDDVMLLFGKSLNVALRLLNIKTSLDPRRSHHINTWSIKHFLNNHLPPPSAASSTTASAAAASAAITDPTSSNPNRPAAPDAATNGAAQPPAAAAAATAAAASPTQASSGAEALDAASAAGRTGRGAEGIIAALTSTCKVERPPEGAGGPARPLRERDGAAYQEHLGDWLAVLRLEAARGTHPEI